MVAKKRIKRKRLPKKVNVKTKDVAKMNVPAINRKMRMIIANLMFFLILFLVSVLLYSVSGAKMYQDLFLMFAMVSGFVGLAFLIALLVFFFFKLMKKR